MKSALAFVAVVLAAVAALAQTPSQTPPRDQPSVATIGSAVVTGTVVADDEPRAPLRRATVGLSRGDVEDIRSTTTDDQGRYVFDHLPAGSYTLGASKGAYLSMGYGAPKPSMPGSPVVLAEGETFTAKPIALWRGAVIAGRLADHHGQPVANASVEANQFVTVNSERRRRTGSRAISALTNAHGDYRIYGLMPGEYLVLVGAAATGGSSRSHADGTCLGRARHRSGSSAGSRIHLRTDHVSRDGRCGVGRDHHDWSWRRTAGR